MSNRNFFRFSRHLSIAMLAFTFIGCTAAKQDVDEEELATITKLNESSTYTSGGNGSQWQLAIELDVSEAGVTPVGQSLVYAPLKTDGADADIQIQAVSLNGNIAHSYNIADPRIGEIDQEGLHILPSARTFVFIPLSADINTVNVNSISERTISQGLVVQENNSFSVLPLAVKACQESSVQDATIEDCDQIVQALGN